MAASTTNSSAEDEARQLLDAGKPEEAKARLEAIAKGDESGPQVAMLHGVAEFRLKRFDRAEALFREVLEAQSDHDKAVYYLGLALERQGRADEALDAYREAVRLRPDFSEAREKLEEQGEEPPAEDASPARDEPRFTDFSVPRNEAELERYRERRLAKERAEFWIPWKAQPGGVKIFQSIFVGLVLVWIIGVFVFLAGAWLGFWADPAPDDDQIELNDSSIPEAEVEETQP